MSNGIYGEAVITATISVGDFGSLDHGEYTGEYTVSPTFADQTLQTKNKILRDNVKVNAIRVEKVSNPKGGKTAYIGGNFVET